MRLAPLVIACVLMAGPVGAQDVEPTWTGFPIHVTDLPSRSTVLLDLDQCPANCVPVEVAQRMLEAPDRQANVLAITYITMAGTDIAMTAGCAGAGTCKELNPVLAGMINSGHYGWAGATKMGIAAVTTWAAYRFTRPHSRQRYVALGTMLVLQAAVVGYNASQQVGR